jgi:hypothetical protein
MLSVSFWVHADEQRRRVAAGILELRSESPSGFRSPSLIWSLAIVTTASHSARAENRVAGR